MLKDVSRQITVAEMSPHVHNFGVNENKVEKISNWLINWIKFALKNKKIKPYDLLPSKGDLAFHIGVSKGTMQNVFRLVEDYGLVKSKQRIGTYINGESEDVSTPEKLTSKRELVAQILKKYLKDNNYKAGDVLISIRRLSSLLKVSCSTIRIAITTLISEGVLARYGKTFVVVDLNYHIDDIEPLTLVEKIAQILKDEIKKDFFNGEKLPTNVELAERFDVSIKTIHDAIKLLVKEGVLLVRRGQYGTVVADTRNESELYFYEKVEQKIRHYIVKKCKIGDKLPSINSFAKNFEVSQKTIKKALDELADDGYLMFTRGRYGGTFVIDMPQNVNEAYKWLAISSDYVSNT